MADAMNHGDEEITTMSSSLVVDRMLLLLQEKPSDLEITVLQSGDKKVACFGDVDVNQAIVLADGHLGLDARAFPWIVREIRRIYHILKKMMKKGQEMPPYSMMQVTSCLLLVNPDHSTGWADRRLSLLKETESCDLSAQKILLWQDEISFLNLLMTQHSKA